RGDRRLARGLPLRPARRPAGELREPAAALHRLEGAQPRVARGRGAARLLRVRVRDHRGREQPGLHRRERGGGLRAARLPLHPAGGARELGGAGGGAEGRAASARRAGPAARGPAHAFALVGRRQEHARGDGGGGAGARLRLLRGPRPLALPARGPDGAAGEGDRHARRTRRAAEAVEGRRGEHQGRRPPRRPRRGAGRALLGRRLDPHGLRPLAHRARARDDGEPARRRHRPPHRPQEHAARADGDRPRACDREGARDRDVPRDQLAAGPARPARRERPAGRRGRGADRDFERRAPAEGARLRRLRRRPGAAGVAHGRAGREHAYVGSAPEADEEVSLREDGPAALGWVASYLEHVRERPALAQVSPGEIRTALAASPPERGEEFAAVLRDLDEVLLPGVTHWQSPRFFAYFSTTGSEPAVLADLLAAGLNQVGILWRTSPVLQELEEVTLAWLPPRPRRPRGRAR